MGVRLSEGGGLRSRAGVAALLGGVAAAALAAGVVVAVGGDHPRVDATTAVAVRPPPVPTEPTRVAWRWRDGSAGITTVAAAGAGVVVATDRGVYGLDGRTGAERWHHRRTDAGPDGLVAVDGGRGVVTSFGGRLHAFDAFTGELRWSDDPAAPRAPERGFLSADTLVVGDRSSHIAAVDARTGAPRWEYPPGPGSSTCRAWTDVDVIADTVILSTNGCVDDGGAGADGPVALDAATGRLLWQKASDRFVVHDGVVYEPDTATLLDPRSGRPLRVPVGGGRERWRPVSALGSGEIVFSDPATLTRTGEPGPLWQASPELSVNGAVALDGTVVVLDGTCTDGAELRVLNRSDGTERRRFACDGVLPTINHFPSARTADVPVLVPAPGALVVRGTDELVGIL